MLISYGIVRYNINQLSNMKYDIAFYDTKQYCVIWNIIWYNMILYYFVKQYDIVA